jgi:hypothetical protein
MHPNCRGATTAAIDQRALEGMKRRARDPVTGETVTVGAWMTYGDWRAMLEDTYGKERVDGAIEAQQYAQRREAADMRQWERYRSVLQESVPKTFAAFRAMKERGGEAFADLRDDCRYALKVMRKDGILLTEFHKVLPVPGEV